MKVSLTFANIRLSQYLLMSSQDVTAKLSKLKLQAKAKVAKEAREAKGGKSDTTKKDGAAEKEKVILESMK